MKLQNLNILVVEDDVDLREALVSWLEEEGPTVFQAGNGREALALLTTNSVDFVISDIKMPQMNGMELLEAIRGQDPKIPVVLLTTGESAVTDDMAKAAGAVGLLPKPFAIEELIETIIETLNLSKVG
jgi:CheY-like chemotaxis protein